MPFIQEAPVFQLTYDLFKDIHIAKNNFKKPEKYALGGQLEQTVLTVLIHIITAGQTKKEWKVAALDNALRETEKVKILIRLAWDIKQIDERRMISWQERAIKIGQQLGGWRKAT